ncbi:hypothetical protein OG223_53770 [Streptomyces sp. NBC_01478]|uniref:hypothetical protein n=1 Tax=Streptomyces sp. NBC_01478 TaxID=2903882 RepID=UPI002E2FD868|nr:hypothetical protein [Streptomyces sp. NBC_01478]
MTVWSGLVQERIPADRLSRALSYATLGQLVPVPFGYLAAGPLSRMVGVRTTLAGGALVIVGAAVVPRLVRQIRALAGAGQSAHEPVATEGSGLPARAPR